MAKQRFRDIKQGKIKPSTKEPTQHASGDIPYATNMNTTAEGNNTTENNTTDSNSGTSTHPGIGNILPHF